MSPRFSRGSAAFAVLSLATALRAGADGPSAAPAPPAASAPAPLRWPEVAATVERHPAAREAAARVRGAAGAAAAAGALPNPAVGLSVGEGRPRDGGAARREWGVSVDVPLEALATRGARVGAARANEDGAREDGRQARIEALRELRLAFVTLAHHQAAVEAGEALEAEVARLAGLVRRRVEKGEGRPTEVPRVEIELERLRSALARSRAAAEGQRLRLEAWLDRPVGRVEADLSAPPPLPPLDGLRERAAEASPALRAARARTRAAAEEARAERWERFPKVGLGAARAEELDRVARTVTATITLPLWDWNGGRIGQAEAARDAEQARLDGATRELGSQVAERWHGCQAGQAAARRFQDEVLPRAEGSARTLGRAFELGEASLLDLIDARRVLLETRREHLDLLLDMQASCGDLAALAGLELP